MPNVKFNEILTQNQLLVNKLFDVYYITSDSSFLIFRK